MTEPKTFIGKMCRKCGGEIRYAANKRCVKCAKAQFESMKKSKTVVADGRIFPPSKPGYDPFGRPWGADCNTEKEATRENADYVRQQMYRPNRNGDSK